MWIDESLSSSCLNFRTILREIKTRYVLIFIMWQCREQRKIRCLEWDLNSHLRVSRAPLYQLSYQTNAFFVVFCSVRLIWIYFSCLRKWFWNRIKTLRAFKDKSSRKYFVHLNWTRLATNPRWLDSLMGRSAV